MSLYTARWAISHGIPVPEESKEELLTLLSSKLGPLPDAPTAKQEAKENAKAGLPNDLSSVKGKKIAIVVGHEPSGGAQDERDYNKVVAVEMLRILNAAGAKAQIFEHRYKPYGKRQSDTMARIEKAMGKPWVNIELHFDSYPKKSVKGHHFQYIGAEKLATAIRDRFEAHGGPESPRRFEHGIYKNVRGNGAGFLRKSAGWACLVEPFFRSHSASWNYWKNRQADIAMIYCLGIADFAKK